ncbi:hypothetical protein NW762_014041 [Fusarium torreyae]|uniref:Uncharacterized protein n=1 Tax=Fusarium torreyae TaxID=1237075 RepID=A0A9W8V9W5_9HYPO|nr:hypothetical protein NW762_014041 [Fusarium torreyae]
MPFTSTLQSKEGEDGSSFSWREVWEYAPLRNAALTLSAFHQHIFSPYHTENQEDELLQYHTKALKELRHVVSHRDVDGFADSTEEWLKFLAGGMFLISFEVFIDSF